MNINWKLRFRNKVTLWAIISQTLAIIYAFLGMMGIVPAVGEEEIGNLLFMVLELLALVGIVVDPTTDGIADSSAAMSRDVPKKEG